MLEFVEAYTKPDGTIPLVGDADDGRVQKLGLQDVNDHRYLLSAGAVHVRPRRLQARRAAASGTSRSGCSGRTAPAAFDALEARHRAGCIEGVSTTAASTCCAADRAHVFIDCGEVGMHGRGGHGHSDITSFEVWLDGMNLVTDCGAYLYTASREWRNPFRSTAFHNVVQVDGEELNRLISPDHLWQLRDDARPHDVSWTWPASVRTTFAAGTPAIARLDPPVLVTREVLLNRGRSRGLHSRSVAGRRTARAGRGASTSTRASSADLDGRDVSLRAATGSRGCRSVDAARLD